MGDQLRFVDDSGDTRLAGELVDDGATVGDVLTVQSDGSLAAAANGGSVPSNWCTVTLAVPADPLTVGAPEYTFVGADLTIHTQSGSDFSVGEEGAGVGAIFSAAGGKFACGTYLGNPSDATLDGGSSAQRYLEFAATIGTQSGLKSFGLDQFVPILVAGSALGNLAACGASTEGITTPGGVTASSITVIGCGLTGTDSVPLDNVFGFQMLTIWQTG